MKFSVMIQLVSGVFAKPKGDPDTISSAISGWANAGAWLMSTDYHRLETIIPSHADEPVSRESAEQPGRTEAYGSRLTKDQRRRAMRLVVINVLAKES